VKKLQLRLVIVSIALLALTAFSRDALAQGTPSSKATAQINTVVYCNVSNATSPDLGTAPMACADIFSGKPMLPGADNFVDIMTTTMKVSNSQSLFVSPSLVTGLYTNTLVKTKTGGNTSTATAQGGVYLRAVLKDPSSGLVVQIGDPVAICTNDILGCKAISNDYGVVLDSRVQTLTQTLSDCVVNLGLVAGTCSFDSTIQLILQTTSAHTFNFIFPSVGVGVYNVVIQAAVDSNATVGGSGTAVGGAAFGLGSVTVESVRLVHSFAF
jgi:hypothetical protein